ncbi:MAG: hypothetical protein K0Q59_4980, partial [Paenibacillus sp.]|nr:hypothetical protein [Paenibacillus sp.]
MSVVGILVDHRVFRNLTSGKTGHEQVRLYNKAAARIGLSVIYLCLERTHPADGTAYGYRYAGGRYHYEKVRIPRVIHNRTMPTTATNRARMKRLRKTRFVFNARNRYSKYSIHRMLAG